MAPAIQHADLQIGCSNGAQSRTELQLEEAQCPSFKMCYQSTTLCIKMKTKNEKKKEQSNAFFCYQLLKYHSSYKALKRHFRNLINKNYAESEEFWWESTCSS